MKPIYLLEIILYVEDMQSQVIFYRDVMGLEIDQPSGLTDYSAVDWVTFKTGACSLVLHRGGQRRFGEDAPKFVFSVNDINLSRDYLISRGVEMSGIRTAAPGIKVCDGCDPEGNSFSIESRNQSVYG